MESFTLESRAVYTLCCIYIARTLCLALSTDSITKCTIDSTASPFECDINDTAAYSIVNFIHKIAMGAQLKGIFGAIQSYSNFLLSSFKQHMTYEQHDDHFAIHLFSTLLVKVYSLPHSGEVLSIDIKGASQRLPMASESDLKALNRLIVSILTDFVCTKSTVYFGNLFALESNCRTDLTDSLLFGFIEPPGCHIRMLFSSAGSVDVSYIEVSKFGSVHNPSYSTHLCSLSVIDLIESLADKELKAYSAIRIRLTCRNLETAGFMLVPLDDSSFRIVNAPVSFHISSVELLFNETIPFLRFRSFKSSPSDIGPLGDRNVADTIVEFCKSQRGALST